jgi:hypothetical protein
LDTITVGDVFVYSWAINLEYIFKIYSFFFWGGGANRYRCYPTKMSGVTKMPFGDAYARSYPTLRHRAFEIRVRRLRATPTRAYVYRVVGPRSRARTAFRWEFAYERALWHGNIQLIAINQRAAVVAACSPAAWIATAYGQNAYIIIVVRARSANGKRRSWKSRTTPFTSLRLSRRVRTAQRWRYNNEKRTSCMNIHFGAFAMLCATLRRVLTWSHTARVSVPCASRPCVINARNAQ